MIFKWLKKLFGLYDSSPTEIPVNGEPKPSAPKSLCDELDKRKERVKQNRDKLKQSPTDWYSLNIPSQKDELQTRVFSPRKFENIPSLQALKDDRLRKEAHELKVQEEKVKLLLDKLETFIAQQKLQDAKQIINEITHEIVRTKNSVIREQYETLQKSLSELESELEREKLIRLAEEQKRKEEEERERNEREERKRIEKEKKIAEERRRRQQEADRLVEEARKKEQAELTERKRLEVLSTERKENWFAFKQVLDNNGIQYLYHFTDRRNIPSIKLHGGLFSWHYCKKNNITIPCQGGDYDSQELDKKYGLEDYVRLSFCNDHPMAYRLQQSGSDIVILKIEVDVALLKGTLFSDINAADKLHTHGGELDDLKRVNFNATKRNYVRKDDDDFKPHQAEVMVKTFVPKKYIVNMIYIESKKRKLEKIKEEYPNAVILDITSNSETRYAKILSPFYPHGNIPIPFTDGLKATCVEAVWQGLKVFENAGVDFATFKNDTMRDLKRTVRKYGMPKGHSKGAYSKELLGYFEARMLIYLPTYKWVLDNVPEVHHVIERIKAQSKIQDIVLLDYNTNIDFRDISKPLSHAGLVKLYIDGKYPNGIEDYQPMTQEEMDAKKVREKELRKELKRRVKEHKSAQSQKLFEE